jgi:predicted NAD/FAD-dependent oxidoreductase
MMENTATALFENEDTTRIHHVIIIGAGVSGLMAANDLIVDTPNSDRFQVTIVECNDYVGGRIKGLRTIIPGHVVELGAEFVHGKKNILTNYLDTQHQSRWDISQPLYQPAFTTSFADGGPDVSPTADGKYAMYYFGGELLMFDDERLYPLDRVLGTMTEFPDIGEFTSLHDVLKDLPPTLYQLAIAGYGNTAGNTRLNDTSLSMMLEFERHWGEEEGEGNSWINSVVSMSGVVQSLHDDLKICSDFDYFLNWNVASVEEFQGGVRVRSDDGKVIDADSVIVTIPPKYWSSIMELPLEKEIARSFIGGEKVMKVILRFKESPWPHDLEGLICGDSLPVPEFWFRHILDNPFAVGFLNSEFAENMLQSSKGDCEQVTKVVFEQLSHVLNIPLEEWKDKFIEAHVHVWELGYMFPKTGLTPFHLNTLSEPHGNIYFAGEGTHTKACCTVQAAMETGKRAAKQIREKISKLHGNS